MIRNLIYTVLFVLFVSALALAQEADTYIEKRNNGSSYVDVATITSPQRVKTQEEISIIRQMRQLRRSGTATPEKLFELQKRLDAISKETVTIQPEYIPFGYEYAKPNPPFTEPDVIGNTLIINRPNIKSFATATETVGWSAGRIWAVICFSGTGTSTDSDSLRVFYSTNHGASWILYASLWIQQYKINEDDLDIEIMENTTSNKSMYIVCGVKFTELGHTYWLTSGMKLELTGNTAPSAWIFRFYGTSPTYNNRYYNVKITTDEFMYAPNYGYLYVVCSFDSNKTTGFKRINQRFAYCVAPYVSNPVFTYRMSDITTDTSTVYPASSTPYLSTDIAYFKHSDDDSLIVSFSNLTDSTAFQFTKLDELGNTGFIYNVQTYSYPTHKKSNLKIVSNSNDNGFISCTFNQFTDNKWTVKQMLTNNWGDFRYPSYYSNLFSGNFGASKVSMIGVKNGSVHFFSFVIRGIANDSLVYYKLRYNDGSTIIICGQMNHSSNWWLSDNLTPAVGIRHVNNDSAFVLYSDINNSQVWSAYGRTPPITGIGNIEKPLKFELHQNYPNPFNPETKINYDIPKQSLVTLKIFDITGRLINTLVNEIKSAGSYTVDIKGSELPSGVYFYEISAGDYKATKKMILLK